MSAAPQPNDGDTSGKQAFDAEIERLQDLLTALESVNDPTARSAARELVQVVLGLHAQGLAELIGIIEETGSQPADTVLPKLAANPKVRGLLLLHDLHPEDLTSRVRQAVARLRPHLGVRGVRAELASVSDGVVRIQVTANGQVSNRPPAAELWHDIEQAVVEMAPDAADVVIDGLVESGGAAEAYVPLSSITRSIAHAQG